MKRSAVGGFTKDTSFDLVLSIILHDGSGLSRGGCTRAFAVNVTTGMRALRVAPQQTLIHRPAPACVQQMLSLRRLQQQGRKQ